MIEQTQVSDCSLCIFFSSVGPLQRHSQTRLQKIYIPNAAIEGECMPKARRPMKKFAKNKSSIIHNRYIEIEVEVRIG